MRYCLPGIVVLLTLVCPGCYVVDDPVMPDKRIHLPEGLVDTRGAFVRITAGDERTALDTGCPCFTEADLNGLLRYTWTWGWWSDVPGCKDAPYSEMLEVWVADAMTDGMRYNIGVQAGRAGDRYHLSWVRFNHQTGRFDKHCIQEVTREAARPCMTLLGRFIGQLRVSHPDWDYCVRFP